MTQYINQLQWCLDAGVPLIAINTPDYSDVLSEMISKFNEYNIIHWDTHRGAIGANPSGLTASEAMNGEGSSPAVETSDPNDCFRRALDLMPKNSILVMDDVHLLLESKNDEISFKTIQGVRNLRDAFKSSQRSLVIMSPGIKLPLELVNDFRVIDVPFPDSDVLNKKTREIFLASGLPDPSPDEIGKSVSATLGLSRFAAENSMATAIRKTGLDYNEMWETKKSYIRQTGGLSVPNEVSAFSNLGGLQGIIKKGKKIINGKLRPVLVVLLDEIDKWIVSLGDSNGINADAFGQLLGAFQDYGWDGITLPGFAGTGKTEWAKAMAFESGGLFIQMDLGGAKGGVVGDSERMIRAAIGMLRAMSQGMPVFFVATCNNMNVLKTKPELLRRLSYGVHFFDLPTIEEQAPIWDIYTKKFSIQKQVIPECPGYTGSEIKKICKAAYEFDDPLTVAIQGITPVYKLMGAGAVDDLRIQAASEGWLSATTGVPYTKGKSLDLEKLRKFVDKKGQK